jgi:hypothetical protein
MFQLLRVKGQGHRTSCSGHQAYVAFSATRPDKWIKLWSSSIGDIRGRDSDRSVYEFHVEIRRTTCRAHNEVCAGRDGDLLRSVSHKDYRVDRIRLLHRALDIRA